MILAGGTEKLSETFSSATNPTRADMCENSSLQGERLETNHMSHVTVKHLLTFKSDVLLYLHFLKS
jgi:hypothetical protein